MLCYWGGIRKLEVPRSDYQKYVSTGAFQVFWSLLVDALIPRLEDHIAGSGLGLTATFSHSWGGGGTCRAGPRVLEDIKQDDISIRDI